MVLGSINPSYLCDFASISSEEISRWSLTQRGWLIRPLGHRNVSLSRSKGDTTLVQALIRTVGLTQEGPLSGKSGTYHTTVLRVLMRRFQYSVQCSRLFAVSNVEGIELAKKGCFWGVSKMTVFCQKIPDFERFPRRFRVKMFPVTVIFYSTPPTGS